MLMPPNLFWMGTCSTVTPSRKSSPGSLCRRNEAFRWRVINLFDGEVATAVKQLVEFRSHVTEPYISSESSQILRRHI